MKTLLFTLVCIGCLVGCNDPNVDYRKTPEYKQTTVFGFGLRIVEIDSCQYVLYVDDGRSSVAMVHHANCKYCRERNWPLIQGISSETSDMPLTVMTSDGVKLGDATITSKWTYPYKSKIGNRV